MEDVELAKKIEDISKVLNEIKFKKKFFGGVDGLDVWNKIESINLEYKELFEIMQTKINILEEKLDEKK